MVMAVNACGILSAMNEGLKRFKKIYGSMIPFVSDLPNDDLIFIGIFVTRRITICILTS